MQYTPEEEEIIYQQQLAQQQGQSPPIYQAPPPGKDSEFLQWLFNLKKQTLEPLSHSWRGEVEVEPGKWELPKKPEDRLAIMNEKGVIWATTLIAGYLNPVFIITNYDEDQMFWVMRKVGRVTWDGLSQNYVKYGIEKINIPRVANEIIHKIHAILLGARANGYREFFSKTHSVSEVRSTNLTAGQQQPQQKKGLFGIFKPKQQEIYEG